MLNNDSYAIQIKIIIVLLSPKLLSKVKNKNIKLAVISKISLWNKENINTPSALLSNKNTDNTTMQVNLKTPTNSSTTSNISTFLEETLHIS